MFEPLTQQFYTAKYYPEYPTLENSVQGTVFRFEHVNERKSTYSQPINNLLSKTGRFNISTTTRIHIVVGGYVLTQEGRMYVIEELAEDDDINPQRAFFFRDTQHTKVLSLVECDNPLELTV